jgi:hypothetical protein
MLESSSPKYSINNGCRTTDLFDKTELIGAGTYGCVILNSFIYVVAELISFLIPKTSLESEGKSSSSGNCCVKKN